MYRVLLLLCAFIYAEYAAAQTIPKPVYSGMYIQWGYNRDKFSRSTIHFRGEGYDFTLHDVTASDKPDFSGFRTNPIDITIPQNSLRIGVYLNKDHTHAIEFNFDHAKYVVDRNQRARLTGTLPDGDTVYDKDTTISKGFIHFEHSNGANFAMINYVGQRELAQTPKRALASCVWKLGAGVVVPRSDVRIRAIRQDNVYHIAGYILAAEGGLRFYPLRNLFLEATVKGGYANFLDVLTINGGKASHSFVFGEVIGLLGYDLHTERWFKKKKKTTS